MKAPAIFACRGDSEVTATFLTRTPTPVIAAMQLVAFATAAATLWLLYSQRMQKWDALQRWTQAVRCPLPLPNMCGVWHVCGAVVWRHQRTPVAQRLAAPLLNSAA